MAQIQASGELVQVGDRMVRRVVELIDDRDPLSPSLYLRVEMINGAPQCRELRFTCPEGADEIRSTDVRIRMGGRWTGIDELVEHLVARIVQHRRDEDGNDIEIMPADEIDRRATRSALRSATRAQRSHHGPKLWAEVAEVYRANPAAPTKAVGEHFGIKSRTAALWVDKARAAKALGPAIKGKAGEH